MKLRRHFTTTSSGPYDGLSFRASPAGAEERFVSAPAGWPLHCVEAFSRHGLLAEPVPASRRRKREKGVPQRLAGADTTASGDCTTHECDVRQAIDRTAGYLARAGWDAGIFAETPEVHLFHDELRAVLATRLATFAPALWQSAGRAWAYGLVPSAGQRDEPGTTALEAIPLESEDAAAALAQRRARRANAMAMAHGRTAMEGADAASWALHLDADSDIWDVLGPEPPLVAGLDRDDDPAALAAAVHNGVGAAASFESTVAGWLLAAGSPLRNPLDGHAVPAPGTPMAALDLGRFVRHGHAGAEMDLAGLCQTVRILTLALACAARGDAVEIRLTNVAHVLMAHGLAYGSDEGRAMAATLAAFVTATALEGAAALAGRTSMASRPADGDALRIIANMQRALLGQTGGYEGLAVAPQRLYPFSAGQARILDAARTRLEAARIAVCRFGLGVVPVVSAAANTATDHLLAVEAAGLAPMTALVRHHRLAGSVGEATLYKVLSAAVSSGLRALSHGEADIERLLDYVTGTGTLAGAPGIDHDALRELGFAEEDIEAVESALATSGSLRAAFTPWVLGWDTALALPDDADGDNSAAGRAADDALASADLLDRLGFTDWDVEHASLHCCGAMTLEGAPGLPREHLPVFDCLAPLGTLGARAVSADDRIRMAAAVQPFLTGGISLDLTLPRDTEEGEIACVLHRARALGVAAIRVRRDGTDLTDPAGLHLDQPDAAAYQDPRLAGGGLAFERRLADIARRVEASSVEHEAAATWHPLHAGGDTLEGDDALTAAIAVGLSHGVPVEAYSSVLSRGGSLQRLADTYLAWIARPVPDDAGPLRHTPTVFSRQNSAPISPLQGHGASRASEDAATSPPSVHGRARKVRPGQEGA